MDVSSQGLFLPKTCSLKFFCSCPAEFWALHTNSPVSSTPAAMICSMRPPRIMRMCLSALASSISPSLNHVISGLGTPVGSHSMRTGFRSTTDSSVVKRLPGILGGTGQKQINSSRIEIQLFHYNVLWYPELRQPIVKDKLVFTLNSEVIS